MGRRPARLVATLRDRLLGLRHPRQIAAANGETSIRAEPSIGHRFAARVVSGETAPKAIEMGARPVRRFLIVLTGTVVYLASYAGAASASTTPTACVTAGTATYRHSFDGAGGTATISAVQPLCAGQSQTFSLVSYTTTPQFVYDTDRATVDAHHRTARLAVAVPACYTEVDLIFGTGVLNEPDDTPYGTLAAGSPTGVGSRSSGALGDYHGGGSTCVPMPTVTFTSTCAGAFRATLANDAAANTSAVFVVAGRRIRVAPGRSAGVASLDRGTLSVRDNTLTTHISTWSAPSSGCATPPAPAAATPVTAPNEAGTPSAAAQDAAATLRPTATTESASSATETTSTSSAEVAIPALATPSPALPTTGPGLGSTVLIALGLLMIGTGALTLVRLIQTTRHP